MSVLSLLLASSKSDYLCVTMTHLQCCTWQHSHMNWPPPKKILWLCDTEQGTFASQFWEVDLFFVVHKAPTVLKMDWKNSCSHVSSKTVKHAVWWKTPCAAGGREVPVWKWAPQHRWAPWCRCTSAPVVPEGLWLSCVKTAGAFCTLNSVSHQ